MHGMIFNLVLIIALIASAHAFMPSRQPLRTLRPTRRALGGENDPTKTFIASIANVVQNIVTNSPINKGKQALVAMLAGNYDVVATKAKLDGLISDEPVVMLSFTT